MNTEATTFKGKYHYGTGRRKTASARVRLYSGKGEAVVNDKSAKDYFGMDGLVSILYQPLEAVGFKDKYSISVKVKGGGFKAQAEAIRHGVARAILTTDESLKKTLKDLGYLTRDSREKERKKYGLKRARRAPQFSKR
ncbi:MAG: 30S ribosomal protein S9 [Patescibacteria group bacterium]|nr:30S ribosomal protein S9 [Patescibacteria group bacterium]